MIYRMGNPMDFSYKSIVKLLKWCSANGVSRIKLKDFEVDFNVNFVSPKVSAVFSKKTAPLSTENFNALTNEAEVRERLEQLAEDQETIHLEDPSAFEQLLIEKELVNAENEIS